MGRWNGGVARLCLGLTVAGGGLIAAPAQSQSLKLYLSPPGAQATAVAGAATENFDNLALGGLGCPKTLAVGNCLAGSGGSVKVPDQYGGAGASGKYLAVASGSPVTIDQLSNPTRYLGFWWSAGNGGNTITFYDQADNVLATFTTATLTTLLGSSTSTGSITAIDGNSYPKSSYWGNPNSAYAGQGTGEPYAYINLVLSGTSARFAKIVISTTGSPFEFDNLSTAASAQPAPEWAPAGDVAVTPSASAILANPDTAYTSAGTAVSVNVGANDPAWTGSGTPGYQLEGANGGAAHGTVTIANGTATYTPASGFAGVDTFTYLRCKPAPDQAECAQATVTVTVIGATNDSNSTTAGQAKTGAVAGNDTVPAGSTYAVPTGTTTQGGTVTMDSAGAYTYTPKAGFAGMDSFSYTVCAPSPNASVCTSAQVFVAVSPVANDDAGTTQAGVALTGDLKGNDAGAVSGAVFSKVSDPTHGTVTVATDGSYVYTPTAGYTGADSFTYRLCVPNSADAANPLCSVATVNLTVVGAANDSAVTKVDTPVSGHAAANDGTVPAGSTFIKKSDPAHGTVVWSANGDYTYMPAAGYAGPDSFTYDLCTAGATPVCSTATVDLYVIKAENDKASVTPNTPYSGSLKDNDSVPANAVYTQQSAPAHGTVTVNSDGSYTYTPSTGFTGEDSFDYQVCAPSDAGPVCTTAKATLTVASAVPTLSQWGLMLMAGLLGLLGARRRVR